MAASDLAFAAGVFDLAAAAFHLTFWRRFGWPARLQSLDPVNRALMPVMNIALITLFAAIGVALVAAPREATANVFGHWLLGGTAAFWLVRAVIQIPYFGLKHWASIALTALAILGFALHIAPVFL